ncbi:MAG: hypothetical protein KIG85_04505 [Thiopseudomonas sp.]|nr:hypothetical protein [Thiopseudomonas sp.]
MTYLCIYHLSNLVQPIRLLNHAEDIARELAAIGVGFTQQPLAERFDWTRAPADSLAEQKDWLSPLQARYPQAYVERVSIAEGDAAAAARYAKEQAEHDLAGDEWRYFLAGRARVSFHADGHVYALRCSGGDRLHIPAAVKRWFELGDQPRVAFIRLCSTALACQPQLSGNAIAASCPPFED